MTSVRFPERQQNGRRMPVSRAWSCGPPPFGAQNKRHRRAQSSQSTRRLASVIRVSRRHYTERSTLDKCLVKHQEVRVSFRTLFHLRAELKIAAIVFVSSAQHLSDVYRVFFHLESEPQGGNSDYILSPFALYRFYRFHFHCDVKSYNVFCSGIFASQRSTF